LLFTAVSKKSGIKASQEKALRALVSQEQEIRFKLKTGTFTAMRTDPETSLDGAGLEVNRAMQGGNVTANSSTIFDRRKVQQP